MVRWPRIECVRWVAENKSPFAIVKDRRLLSLIKTGRPEYRMPSPATVARDVKHVFVRMRSMMATKLQVSVLSTYYPDHQNLLKCSGTSRLPELRD